MAGFDRFNLQWASAGITNDPTGAQADAGFAFLGPTPPSVELFNSIFQWNDEKDNWLYGQIANVIIDSGQTPDENDLLALLNAIQQMISNYSGNYVLKAGDEMTGTLIVNTTGRHVSLRADAGVNRAIEASNVAGQHRWLLVIADNAAESGGDTGSNLSIIRYNDAGASIDTPFGINRKTGVVSIATRLDVGGDLSIGGNSYFAGSIETTYIKSGGNIDAVGSVIASYVNSSGTIDATGGFNTPVGIWAGADISAGGNVSAAGNVTAAYITSAGEMWSQGKLSSNDSIAFNNYGSNKFALAWGADGGLSVYVNDLRQGLFIRSLNVTTETELQSIQLISQTATMTANYGAGIVSWPITWVYGKSNVKPADIDALAIINAMNIYSMDAQPEMEGVSPEHWACALLPSEIKSLVPNAYRPATEANKQETLVDAPIIATMIRAIQQLSSQVGAPDDNR